MANSIEAVHEGRLKGFLHKPGETRGGGLVITHGASGNCGMALLVTVAEAFSAAGWHVLRCDLPFRQKRPGGPPSPSAAAEDRAALREAATWMRCHASAKVVLGGQSYGGRQASLLAAEEPGLVEALLLLSYPLHPPGKPAQLRTAHFPALRTPALFVEGDRDPFASPQEIREAVTLIPAQTDIFEIAKAGHDLNRGKWNMSELILRLNALGAA